MKLKLDQLRELAATESLGPFASDPKGRNTGDSLLMHSVSLGDMVFLSIPQALLVVDERGAILNANDAFCELFQTAKEGLLGRESWESAEVRWSSPGFEKLLLDRVVREGSKVHEAVVHATVGGGEAIVLQITARRLPSGKAVGPILLVCFEEVTRRKRSEEEREALVVELEDARARLRVRVEERTVQLADSLARLREVSEELILAHESEQRRIARDLHDQVGQDLTALKLMFHRAARDETNPSRHIFAEAEKVTQEAIGNIRSICSTLRPQMLDDLGLLAALDWHLKNFGERSSLRIAFDHTLVDETRLTPLLKSAIFRVIQEALTNVARHAKTREASVVLWMTDRDVLFRVRDRGRGFKTNEMRTPSTGLSSMRERVSLVHGECDITSSVGRGTTVRVQIPLKKHD